MKGTVVITGASGGIGKSTAERFADSGWEVFNLSRRPAALSGVTDIATDVTDENSVVSAFEQIAALSGKIDLLICNAGFGISGAVEFTRLEDAKAQFDVNFFGVFSCVKYALPLLKKSRGRILCISSAAAVFSIPFQAFYSATKASVNLLASALRNELRQFGVTACAVQLGDVRTGFTNARKKSFAGDALYGGIISRSVSVMEKDEQHGMDPQQIADSVYKIGNKKRVRVLYALGMKYKIFCVIQKLLPASCVSFIVGKLYMPKEH